MSLPYELFGQTIGVMGDVDFSKWATAKRLVGPLAMVNSGCTRHANSGFIAFNGRVRLETTRGVAAGDELLAEYEEAPVVCAFPGCSTPCSGPAAARERLKR